MNALTEPALLASAAPADAPRLSNAHLDALEEERDFYLESYGVVYFVA